MMWIHTKLEKLCVIYCCKRSGHIKVFYPHWVFKIVNWLEFKLRNKKKEE